MNNNHIEEAIGILVALGFPRAQQNERSALCLLALLNLKPDNDMAISREAARWDYPDNELGPKVLW